MVLKGQIHDLQRQTLTSKMTRMTNLQVALGLIFVASMELKEKVNKRNDYLKVSNAEIKALLPEIPVGGRLRFFLSHWEKITDDQWVLSVIKEGYKIEFNQIPPKTGIKRQMYLQTI